jgi:ABC-type glycerol-3-phosphate transport system substrate-binding protein
MRPSRNRRFRLFREFPVTLLVGISVYIIPRIMKYPFLFSLASLESPSRSDSEETGVKILHIYPVPKVLEIWQSAALEYEKANPAVKIEFEYLENEEFKATLPTLL